MSRKTLLACFVFVSLAALDASAQWKELNEGQRVYQFQMHDGVFEAADHLAMFVCDSPHQSNDSLIYQSVVIDRKSARIYNPPYSLKRIE